MRPLNYLLPLTAIVLGSLVAVASGPKESVPSPPAGSSDRSLMGRIESSPDTVTASALFALSGLSNRLKRRGPYTVLVPTDQALASDRGLVDELVRPTGKRRLERIMRYHVLRGRHRFLQGGADMRTLSSQPVSISVYKSKGWADDSRLVGRLQAENGYIFLVDRLLVPRGDPARR